jgi:hypothetical protein
MLLKPRHVSVTEVHLQGVYHIKGKLIPLEDGLV